MREIIYNITQRSTGRMVALANLTEEFTKDNLLGIINKTQGEVLYTPLQVGNIQNFQYQEGSMLITLSANVPSINAGDELLVKLYSDKEIDLSAFAKESTLLVESQTIQSAIQNIDLSSVEGKVDEVKQAVEDIKLPEIDTTELAKESTLQELLNRSAYYDSATGNLTIENVNITIE